MIKREKKNLGRRLSEVHQINPGHPLWNECDSVCWDAKNLYNQALYRIRLHFFSTGKYLGYKILQKQMQEENQEDYRKFPAKVSQLVLKSADQNFKSFFRALEQYKIKPSKFLGRPQIPNYKDIVSGRYEVNYNVQTISSKALKEGLLKLTDMDFTIPIDVLRDEEKKSSISKILWAKISPTSTGSYNINISYCLKPEIKLKELDKDRVGSIDLGTSNLAALTTNIKAERPLIISGGPLKSINQYYNKHLSELRSLLATTKSKRGKKALKKEIHTLTRKRNNKIKDYMHKASSILINHIAERNIGSLVIGKNNEWKQEINIGKKNNQTFVSIPHDRFINMMKYKSEHKGIDLKTNEESYTSKCSLLDNESIEKHEKYMGRRIKRGLFKSKNGFLINADVNGSGNIMKKAIKRSLSNWTTDDLIEGFVVNPTRLATSELFGFHKESQPLEMVLKNNPKLNKEILETQFL